MHPLPCCRYTMWALCQTDVHGWARRSMRLHGHAITAGFAGGSVQVRLDSWSEQPAQIEPAVSCIVGSAKDVSWTQ
jgi:hypothetical protein